MNPNRIRIRIFIQGVLGLLLFQTSLFAYLSGALQKAKGVDCVDHLRQIYLVATQYAMDNAERTPASQKGSLDVAKAYSSYLPNPVIFTCPSVHGRESETAGWNNVGSDDIDYGFALGEGARGVNINQSGKVPIAFDRLGDGHHMDGALGKIGPKITFSRNHGPSGGNVVFSDGSVLWIQTGKSWEELQVSPKIEFVQ